MINDLRCIRCISARLEAIELAFGIGEGCGPILIVEDDSLWQLCDPSFLISRAQGRWYHINVRYINNNQNVSTIVDIQCESLMFSIFSCGQAAVWMVLSVIPSICPSACHTFIIMFLSSYHHEIFRNYYPGQNWCICNRTMSEVKGQGHRRQSKFCPKMGFSW